MYITGVHTGDEIIIGDNIRIVILSPRNRRIRIGIEAPPEIKIKQPTKTNKKQKQDKSERKD